MCRKKYENYNFVNVFNTSTTSKAKHLSLREDLSLSKGKYHIYDYTLKQYLGVFDSEIDIDLQAYESRILSVRKVIDIPQILSTSRHISQGAAEICDVVWDNNTLNIKADLIKDDSYTLTLYVPQGYTLNTPNSNAQIKEAKNITAYTIFPENDGICEIKLNFI